MRVSPAPRPAVELRNDSALFVACSLRLCADSRRLVGWSSVLMDRVRRPIGGAADEAAEPHAVVDRLRRLVADGILPTRPDGVWAGRSAGGRRCAGCESSIGAGEIEYEIKGAVLHIRCYELWRSADGEYDILAE
jgi:hypothetical protein